VPRLAVAAPAGLQAGGDARPQQDHARWFHFLQWSMALPNAPCIEGLLPPRTPLCVMLESATMLFFRQSVEIFGATLGFDADLSYALLNATGEKVGKAAEHSGYCQRRVLGGRRPFEVVVSALTPGDPPVLRFVRPYRGSSPGCCWSLQQLRVYSLQESGGETELGMVQQRMSCCGGSCCVGPLLGVHDAQGHELFTVNGPCVYCDGPCCDITFEVRARGEAVGEIRRHGASLTPAMDPVGSSTPFGEDDECTLGLTMPQGAPILHRAMLLGALTLIDVLYFDPYGHRDGGLVAVGEKDNVYHH
jgi:hypothetical protein